MKYSIVDAATRSEFLETFFYGSLLFLLQLVDVAAKRKVSVKRFN